RGRQRADTRRDRLHVRTRRAPVRQTCRGLGPRGRRARGASEQCPRGRGARLMALAPQGGPVLVGDHQTVDEALAAAACQFGEREAYVDGADRITFAEWDRRASLLAWEFAARGVQRGDVVALLQPSRL